MASNEYIAASQESTGSGGAITPSASRLVNLLRALSGLALGIGAVLLPAFLCRNFEFLYAEYGAPVVLLACAPIAILVHTYGGQDEPD